MIAEGEDPCKLVKRETEAMEVNMTLNLMIKGLNLEKQCAVFNSVLEDKKVTEDIKVFKFNIEDLIKLLVNDNSYNKKTA